MAFHQSEILGTLFESTISSAYDSFVQQTVAIRKIIDPFSTVTLAKRTFLEVKLLKQLLHENLICLSDVFISPSEEVYLVIEPVGCDLGRIIKHTRLDETTTKFFMYQIMRGLKYLHSAGVMHYDLQPSNLLVNQENTLKICDFGITILGESQTVGYVPSKFYRAPESNMLAWQPHGLRVDVWSAGCIFAEMLRGVPLFPGADQLNQLNLTTDAIGDPPQEFIDRITSKITREFVDSLPKKGPYSHQLKTIFAGFEESAVDLLEKILVFTPEKRISAGDALQHPYLALYHDPSNEPVAEIQFDWSFKDADIPKETWRAMIYAEAEHFCTTMLMAINDLSGLAWNN
ncbi:mitogen-activated protein kinase mpkC [Aspergillus tanneri]|uniref:Protein kinase domain-containing protein n=1 Tax=Aspergillus tanneri TaxID=1220188 RepID=A0A5M9MXB4_9EURO|nr:uncharacterized protein ATNIH1004_005770 [Aspergillus tanneri]KAA8647087.1 hypothetical protein ATNIH1004_005770 [Aspergillus tanneri]